MHAASNMLIVRSGIWLTTTAGQLGSFLGWPMSHWTPHANLCSSTSLWVPIGLRGPRQLNGWCRRLLGDGRVLPIIVVLPLNGRLAAASAGDPPRRRPRHIMLSP